MKLIVEYIISDGHNCSCQATVPFEYESIEALEAEIERLTRGYMAVLEARRGGYDAFNERWPNGPGKNSFNTFYDELGAMDSTSELIVPQSTSRLKFDEETELSRLPNADEPILTAGKSTLHMGSFIAYGTYRAPYIYTLEEWFLMHDLVQLDQLFSPPKRQEMPVEPPKVEAPKPVEVRNDWVWQEAKNLSGSTPKGWACSFKKDRWVITNDISPATAKLFGWEYWTAGGQIPFPSRDEV